MFKNYFYLKRAAGELNKILKQVIIQEAYSQEKDKLYLTISNDGFPHRHLILSTDTAMSYPAIKNEHFKAKKNTINFFDEILPDKIVSVSIADNDRVIKFRLSKAEIYFYVRGSRTNVMLVGNDGKISSFKRIKQNEIEIRDELMNLNYINESHQSSSSPHIAKEIKIEVKTRNGDDNSVEVLQKVINEILNEKIAVFYSDVAGKPVMCPVTFQSFNIPDDVQQFNNYCDAINVYLTMNYRTATIDTLQNEIEHYLTKEIEKLSHKLNDLQTRLDNGSKETDYKNYGNLLLGNIHLLRKGMKEIELDDYTTNEKIKIKLDPKLSPQKMIDYYFDKSRGERINYEKSHELFETNKNKYDLLINVRKEFENADNLDEYIKIKKKLKLGTKEKLVKQMDIQIRHHHFIIDNKYHVYVGRDNVNNDLLTTKFAKQNDYWFHARSVPGSHVVLRVDNPKEGIPKNILKNAASIAAFYSKAKTSGVAPVSYTFRKYVHKKKGLAAGQVILSKEDVLLVKPEIPKNCLQVEE